MDYQREGGPSKASCPPGLEVLRGLRVVLVDDEPGVLRALTLLLEALHCKVTGFNTPNAALTYLCSQPSVDFVLSDMRMPGLSGAELLKHLRASNFAAPFFLMSGHATHEEVNEARGAGLQGFLSKPFTPRQLAELVSSIMAHPPCPE